MFKEESIGVTLLSRHGTKVTQAILHPRPYNNRAIVKRQGINRTQGPSRKEKTTDPHVLIRRWCKRVYETSLSAAWRKRAYRLWKHYSTTNRVYGR